MTETIGKITLNLDKYPGEDYYCDGSVEDEILDIVKKYSTVEYDRIIAERKSWPILYHLSALRENIVDFLPIQKTEKVLEVGSGCGAITGALARKAGEVTCVRKELGFKITSCQSMFGYRSGSKPYFIISISVLL